MVCDRLAAELEYLIDYHCGSRGFSVDVGLLCKALIGDVVVDTKVDNALCLILRQVAAYQIRVCDVNCYDILLLEILRLVALKQKAVSFGQLIAVEHIGVFAESAQEKAQRKA